MITNLEGADHLETWPGGIESIKYAFLNFANSVPFYGLVILCHDDEHLRDLLPRLKRSYVTYGVSASADYQAAAIYHEAGCVCFTVSIRGVVQGEVRLPLPGHHNVLNALAAVAAADEFSIPFPQIKEALESFRGVGRRFEIAGTFGGVTVVHDYGHHPTEITAVLGGEAGSGATDPSLVPAASVVAPARPVASFGACFDLASDVVVSAVYAASEQPLEGYSEARRRGRYGSRSPQHALCRRRRGFRSAASFRR